MILSLTVLHVYLLLFVRIVNSEFYSSVHQMTKLVKYEGVLLQSMEKFLAENENKLQFLEEKLSEFQLMQNDAQAEGSDYYESPINKYLLTKRLTIDRERIENLMAHNSGEEHIQYLNKLMSHPGYPNVTELEGGIEGLLKIQYIYRLRTRDMANGILDGIQYATELQARHCFDIGKFALKGFPPILGHSWLMEALRRYNTSNESHDLGRALNRTFILEELAKVKFQLGDYNGALDVYKELLELNPKNERIQNAYEDFLSEGANSKFVEIDNGDEHEPMPENLHGAEEGLLFRYTCSGHIKPDPKNERDLRCGYLTETHPFLLLAPIRVEELNHDPLLVLYYDVLSDSEIETLKQLVANRMERAQISGVNFTVVSKARTSQYAFIPTLHHKLLQTIDRRVEDMTNLNMLYSEVHQLANYGIGGHYSLHNDWLSQEALDQYDVFKDKSNRIATVLFYLSDVEQGGGTAFPYLNRLCKPLKGSAIFWHNLHASGVGDRRTKHGACPIIVGSKWVLNRWIYEHYQDDRRPCELYDDSIY